VPSGEPSKIKIVASSSTELEVSWEAPPREEWNGNILGYYVGLKLLGDSGDYRYFAPVFLSNDFRSCWYFFLPFSFFSPA
jgi:hypothetical protein